jgi:hypothetical protein
MFTFAIELIFDVDTGSGFFPVGTADVRAGFLPLGTNLGDTLDSARGDFNFGSILIFLEELTFFSSSSILIFLSGIEAFKTLTPPVVFLIG